MQPRSIRELPRAVRKNVATERETLTPEGVRYRATHLDRHGVDSTRPFSFVA